jgi:hypothetical protein
MEMMGWPSTITGVAMAYEDFLDVLVVDERDATEAIRLQQSGFSQTRARAGSRSTVHHASSARLRLFATNTVMRSTEDKRDLAAFVLDCATAQSAKA